MLNRRILRIKVFKVLYSYAENPSMSLKEAEAELEISCQAVRDLYLYMLSLIPPLTAIRRLFPDIGIGVYFPPANCSGDIMNIMTSWQKKVVFLKKNYRRFKTAIMPDVVSVDSNSASIPAKWKTKQQAGMNAETAPHPTP